MAAGSGGRRRAGESARAAIGGQAPPGRGEPAVVRDFPDGAVDAAGLTQRQRRVLEVIRDSIETPRLPALGPRDRSRPSAFLGLIGGPPAVGAAEEGLAAARPQPARARSTSGCPATARARRRVARRSAEEPERFDHPRPDATCRSSAGSPPVARCSPSRPWRTCSRCPASWSARARCSCSRSSGDSMVDAAICDGDWVVVRQQPTAENGEIVAAMIDGEATVKTYKRRDGHVWLLPHNPAYEPIPGDDATVLGRVVSVLRRV